MSASKTVFSVIGILFACFAIVHCIVDLDNPNEIDLQKSGDLVFAQLFYRHGDRAPRFQAPGDKYDITYWPEGWGQLTNLGKQQQYELGQWLRRRYNTFLSDTFNVSDIYVQSSDVDRTLMSAQANFAGLYPPKGDQIWNKNLIWQPIPIHSRPKTIDNLIAGTVPSTCAAFQNAYNAYEASAEITRFNASFQSIYDYLTANTGSVVNSFSSVLTYRDTWFCESSHHLKLPEWTKKIYPNNDQFDQAALKYEYLSTGTKFLAKFMSGFLLKDILDRFTSKIQNTLSPNRKVWVYSTHDSTLFSFLNALDISDHKFVPYAAAIILELRSYKNENYIQIFYKNSDATPAPINIPGCGISCPLSKMYQIYNNILPKNDFNTECQISHLNEINDP